MAAYMYKSDDKGYNKYDSKVSQNANQVKGQLMQGIFQYEGKRPFSHQRGIFTIYCQRANFCDL